MVSAFLLIYHLASQECITRFIAEPHEECITRPVAKPLRILSWTNILTFVYYTIPIPFPAIIPIYLCHDAPGFCTAAAVCLGDGRGLKSILGPRARTPVPSLASVLSSVPVDVTSALVALAARVGNGHIHRVPPCP